MNYVSAKKASEFYAVSTDTLRRWADSGKVQFITTEGGHRRYAIKEHSDKRKSFIYARVSSKKQEKDLQKQIKHIKKLYPKHEVISDIGSGINLKRKGLVGLLDKVLANNVKEIVVYSSDRLSRFGNDFLEYIFNKFKVNLIIVNESEEKSDEQELAEDLLAVTTVFSARYYGKRKYIKKTKKSKNKIKGKSKKAK
jgi:predicted site-specific integrase-resolvase